jgi:hypothetical protein
MPSEFWPQVATLAVAFAALLVLVGMLLNVHKLLSRVTSVRRDLADLRDTSAQAQLVEAVAQLQSVAVSLDRIALRCDAIEAKLETLVQRAPRESVGEPGSALVALREDLAALRGPLTEIRDLLGRTETERLEDEIKRCLYTRNYDKVKILGDLTSVPRSGETRVPVEVVKDGIAAKGWVLVRDASAVDARISPTLEMFP